jgi:hypothetical protein
MTQDDLNRLRAYTDRLRIGQLLSPVEAHDFYRLTDTMTREYPSNEGTWLLFLLAGIAVGMILSEK